MNKEKLSGQGTFGTIISDHLPIYVNVKRPKKRHAHVTMLARNYTLYTYNNFSNMLLDNIQWKTFWSEDNSIDDKWNIMINIITQSLDKICPTRNICTRVDQQPWIDKDLVAAISLKNNLYSAAIKRRGDDEKWANFKEQRKLVRRLIISKRRKYIIHTINENKNDPKNFWKEINKNLSFGKEKTTTNNISVKNEDGVLVSGKEASNVLNHHYATIGKKLAENISVLSQCENVMIHQPYERMQFRFVTTKEVTNLTKYLKNTKPSGIPNIKTSILKDALLILNIEFTYIINKSLDKSYIP